MAILESSIYPKITVEEAIPIIGEAIKAGIDNNMGSGSNIDICIVRFREDKKIGRNVDGNITDSPWGQQKFRPIVSEYRRHYFYEDPVAKKAQRIQNLSPEGMGESTST